MAESTRIEWKVGDVVQLNPETVREFFGGCFMLITDPKSFGAQGFVQVPGGGRAYCRAKHEDMHLIGRAEWVPEDEQDSGHG